jgi:hypothetical protein
MHGVDVAVDAVQATCAEPVENLALAKSRNLQLRQ